MNTDNKDLRDLSTLSPKTREVVLAFCLLPGYYTTEDYAKFFTNRSDHWVPTTALENFIQESPLFESRRLDYRGAYSPMVYRVQPEVVLANLKYLDEDFIKRVDTALRMSIWDYPGKTNGLKQLYLNFLRALREYTLTHQTKRMTAFSRSYEDVEGYTRNRFAIAINKISYYLLKDEFYYPFLSKASSDLLAGIRGGFRVFAEMFSLDPSYKKTREFLSRHVEENDFSAAWFEYEESFFTNGPKKGFELPAEKESVPESICRGLYLTYAGDFKKAVKAYQNAIKIENQLYAEKVPFSAIDFYNTLYGLALFLDRKTPATLKKFTDLAKWIEPETITYNVIFISLLISQVTENENKDEYLELFIKHAESSRTYYIILQLAVACRLFDDERLKKILLSKISTLKDIPPFLLREALAVVEPESPEFKQLNERFQEPLLLRFLEKVSDWQMGLEKLLTISKTFEKRVTNNKLARIIYRVDPNLFAAKPYLQKSKDGLNWTKGTAVSMSTFVQGMPEMDETDQEVKRLARPAQRAGYVLQGVEVFYALAGSGRTFLYYDPDTPFVIEKDTFRLQVNKDADGAFSVSSNLDNVEFERLADFGCIRVNRSSMKIFKCSDKEKEVLDLFRRLKKIPRDGQKTLTEILENISSEIPVSSELLKDSNTLPAIKGSSEITFRFQPDPGVTEMRVKAFVRPAEGCELTLFPGSGQDTLAALVNKESMRIERNLSQERENYETITAKLEDFDAWLTADNEWVLDIEHALEFMEVLRENEKICLIEWPEEAKLTVRHSPIDFSDLKLNLHSVDRWFSLDGTVSIDGKTQLKINEILDKLKDRVGNFIHLEGNDYVAITQKLRKQLEWIQDIASKKKDKLNLSRFSVQAIEELRKEGAEVEADAAFENLQKRIEEAEDKVFKFPSTLAAELRPYQEEGFEWLSRLADWGAGAILADDMGLGKTIQAIALLIERKAQGPSLVIVPTAVLYNWINEFNRFTPTLRVADFNSGKRGEILENLKDYDVVLCTYGVMNSEIERLGQPDWNVIVLDEAHIIKNKATQTSHSVMKLKSQARVLLSGTPIQNHLSEIWNLFEFANPGYLGSYQQFWERFILPIEKKGDKQKQLLLKQLISPFILRRTKTDVLEELPEKTELTIPVELSEAEMAVYENIRTSALAGLKSDGVNPIEALAALTKLRLAACSPQLVDKKLTIPSTKTHVFIELVKDLIENNHRALVFSQFTSHLALIKEALDKEGIQYLYLDGSDTASHRKKLVEAFQNGEMPLFLISLKAGGTGLNLTGADYVIHLDPWWNPAVEDQASDRAYRIGQKRPVTIYKLIAQKTVEEKIIELHKTKKNLADALLEGSDVAKQLSKEEILELLQLSN